MLMKDHNMESKTFPSLEEKMRTLSDFRIKNSQKRYLPWSEKMRMVSDFRIKNVLFFLNQMNKILFLSLLKPGLLKNCCNHCENTEYCNRCEITLCVFFIWLKISIRHWRTPHQKTCSHGRPPHLGTSCSWIKTFASEINEKNYENTNCSGVLSGRGKGGYSYVTAIEW